ncbi:MAG TPA: LysM peptidoglycan-binding domain-containing protein [Anaerolineae bacterium]|nr:LysM peptidoglycan-binding domain-containing protein [Anaerolineae bacterium]
MNRRIRGVAMVLALSVLLGGLASPVWSEPGSGPRSQGTGSTIHIVQWGETLNIIASRYGVSAASIAQANGLWNPNFIYAGQRLVIPTAAAPAPQPGATTTYVVQRGDTLNVIAARFGTTATQLASLNGLWNPNFIYVGQMLKVPGSASPSTPPATTCTYWVKRGDTLTTIALQYRTTVWALAIANNLANPSFIWVGQQLTIPGCSQGSAPAPTPAPTPVPVTGGPKAVILVVWDGTQRAHLQEMLGNGQLPNLSALIAENQPLTWPVIKSQTCRPGSEAGYRTDTGPGNSAMATGLGYEGMGNWTNDDPHPIPDGRTLWEWFKPRGYATGMVSSKDEPFWPNTTLDNARGEIDYWKVSHQPQSWVTDNALAFIRVHAGGRFFLWVHYREPDSLGHGYGENSAEYTQALVTDDQELGRLVAELGARDILGQTMLILTTDHGFNEGGMQHDTCSVDTKNLFLAVNKKGAALSGCIRYQTDFAPCIWALY